ncbi:MAG: peptidoglycan-associated lipoprotein Pal [Sulfuricella sp.]|jgi:peptidoglycan-associated lipoprotein
MKKVVQGLLLVGVLGGCAAQDVKDTGVAKQAAPAAQQGVAKPADQKAVPVNPLKDPNNILSKRSVYYDFDKPDVKAEYKPMVEAHAMYVTGHKDVKITLQGNTDERGSREYNIALGNRRAEGVRKMMNVLGVPDSQIETVSFGEEKPRATCNDESCWKENRRADIVYEGEK